MVFVVAFLSQICLRLLGACTFTLPAWLRVVYVAVPFLCGRVWYDCTSCVRCGCTTCVRCGYTSGYTSDYTTRVRYVCSYTTRVRCVRDEDTSRRFRSCTGQLVGSCPALRAKERRKFRSHDSDALVLRVTSSTNISHLKPVHRRCPTFIRCKTVLTNYGMPVGQP